MPLLIVAICLIMATPVDAATVYLTRHYEKTRQPSPSLTEKGKQRANALAVYLDAKAIKEVYSTAYKRTLQTSTPLSKRLGITITEYSPDKLKTLAEYARTSRHNLVIVGHSNTTPQLIELLGGPSVTIGENDYGTLYELQVEKDGTTMTETTITPH